MEVVDSDAVIEAVEDAVVTVVAEEVVVANQVVSEPVRMTGFLRLSLVVSLRTDTSQLLRKSTLIQSLLKKQTSLINLSKTPRVIFLMKS